MQQINEKPEHRAVAAPLAEIQSELTQKEREAEEIRIELSRPHQTEGEDAFATYLTKEGAFAIDQRSELREKLRDNERRQSFLQSALERGRRTLDTVTGQLSLTACQEIRPRFVEAIKEQLSGLRQVCKANAKLIALRDELESAGYQSGSLPFAQFTPVDRWESEYGSTVQFHRQYIKQHFPEIKD